MSGEQTCGFTCPEAPSRSLMLELGRTITCWGSRRKAENACHAPTSFTPVSTPPGARTVAETTSRLDVISTGRSLDLRATDLRSQALSRYLTDKGSCVSTCPAGYFRRASNITGVTGVLPLGGSWRMGHAASGSEARARSAWETAKSA